MRRRSTLDRLLQGLLRAPHDYRPTTDTFPDLDPKKVAQELRLEDRGRERAFRREPARPADQLDDIETEIVEYVEADKKHAHQILAEELQSYEHRLASLDFHKRLTDIHLIAPNCVTEFHAERATGEGLLLAVRKRLQDHETEHENFRKDHHLARPARTHTPAASFVKWSVLFVLLAIECILNGTLLAKGSELGEIGGISEAIFFAVLNVGVACGAAVFARLVTHRNRFWNLIGALAVIAWFCFTLVLNLALAHYREVAGTFVANGGQEVINRLREAPLDLHEIQSWVLFGMGIFFAFIAFADTLLLLDPYWGYGSQEKRLKKAWQRYQDEKADRVAELRDIYSEFSEELGEISQDLSARLGEFDRIIAARKNKIELFDTYQAQLEKAVNALLSTYRAARGIASASPYRLKRIQVSANNPGSAQRAEIEGLVKEAQSVLRTQLQRLQQEFDEGLKRYDEIDKLGAKPGANNVTP